jgi:excinuclease UvrABC nuclease subunit
MNKLPNLKISGEEFNSWPKIYVYAWMRGIQCLYVGQTIKGYSRLCTHHILNKKDFIVDTDEILIWNCANEADSLQLEKELITYYEPLYNAKFKETAEKEIIFPELNIVSVNKQITKNIAQWKISTQ